MSFKQLAGAARTNIEERFASPLMGSFIVSFVVCNFKLFIILLSTTPVAEKFALIAKEYPDFFSGTKWCLLYPLAGAAFYIYALPYPSRVVSAHTLRQQLATLEKQRQIEGAALLTVAESRSLRKWTDERLREKDVELAELRALIPQETLMLRNLEATKTTLEARQAHPTPEEMSMLRKLEAMPAPVWDERIRPESGRERSKVDLLLTSLVDKNLIKRTYEPLAGAHRSELTDAGRRALVQGDRDQAP